MLKWSTYKIFKNNPIDDNFGSFLYSICDAVALITEMR